MWTSPPQQSVAPITVRNRFAELAQEEIPQLGHEMIDITDGSDTETCGEVDQPKQEIEVGAAPGAGRQFAQDLAVTINVWRESPARRCKGKHVTELRTQRLIFSSSLRSVSAVWIREEKTPERCDVCSGRRSKSH